MYGHITQIKQIIQDLKVSQYTLLGPASKQSKTPATAGSA